MDQEPNSEIEVNITDNLDQDYNPGNGPEEEEERYDPGNDPEEEKAVVNYSGTDQEKKIKPKIRYATLQQLDDYEETQDEKDVKETKRKRKENLLGVGELHPLLGLYGRGIFQKGCSKFRTNLYKPQHHQEQIVNYFLNSPYKGILLYHKLGSGKTCTAIEIADKLLDKRVVKDGKEWALYDHVYVLIPGTLRQGWITEYCGVCGKDKNRLKQDYTFITYNHTTGHRFNQFDINSSVVIIDEVHNLINGVKNESEHYSLIYKKLYNSSCKIIALSGTPIFNYFSEFAILGRLLKPEDEMGRPDVFPDVIGQIGPTQDNPFSDLFQKSEESGTLTPYNEKVIQKMFEGIISYSEGSQGAGMPVVKHEEPIRIRMSPHQEYYYWGRKSQEDLMSRRPSEEVKRTKGMAKYQLLVRLYIMAKKNIMTRQASNFYYPEDLRKDKEKHKLSDGLWRPKREMKPKEVNGWVSPGYFDRQQLLKIYSPKIAVLIANISRFLNQKHVVFTFFKDKAGVILLRSIINMCKIPRVKAEIFSGDLDDSSRTRLLNKFNAPNNREGNIIKILLVTEAGAEGISIKEARHFHILESGPRVNKIVQAMGRIARYKSHILLPEKDRTVSIWRYWSIASPDPVYLKIKLVDAEGTEKLIEKTITDKTCIDEILYENGQIILLQINSFLDILRINSVENTKKYGIPPPPSDMVEPEPGPEFEYDEIAESGKKDDVDIGWDDEVADADVDDGKIIQDFAGHVTRDVKEVMNKLNKGEDVGVEDIGWDDDPKPAGDQVLRTNAEQVLRTNAEQVLRTNAEQVLRTNAEQVFDPSIRSGLVPKIEGRRLTPQLERKRQLQDILQHRTFDPRRTVQITDNRLVKGRASSPARVSRRVYATIAQDNVVSTELVEDTIAEDNPRIRRVRIKSPSKQEIEINEEDYDAGNDPDEQEEDYDAGNDPDEQEEEN